MKQNNLEQVYKRLFEAFGAQNWWPGETQLEVIVGAVLTQNTAWQNVKRAIVNLKGAGVLSLNGLIDVGSDGLAELIRPSGYFNVKAKRLKAVVNFLSGSGGIKGLETAPTVELRRMLLDVNGVGEETADSILLYAFNRPVFVVDAYTKRIFSRLGLLDSGAGYAVVQEFFENSLPSDVNLYNEYHALIVRLGKDFCKKTRPQCLNCPLNDLCEFQNTPEAK
ncbi:endonuclease III [archaeon BMS3Abin16]|nr:endonuclease III [archaeon BMS3Abin16]